MGCGSCGSGGCGSGACGSAAASSSSCATGGCNKLNTFDWLGNMLAPGQTEVDNVYEVRFKNTHKAFFRNVNGLKLYIGDFVVVEAERGFDIGRLSLGGVMAQLQMKKKGVKNRQELPRIYRKASDAELDTLQSLREREHNLLVGSRLIADEMELDMKIADVEYQGDGTKATFYYTADQRVDFRELIKRMAREFHLRVEMRQIGPRHEAGLVGGIGVCGRELCCSTWLTDFRNVGTAAARYQNLSLNPQKISGQCGRLKCCLNYELDAYTEALAQFPKADKLQTVRGIAYLQKTDIFKGLMWYAYRGENTWYPLTNEEVKRILAETKEGRKPESLSDLAEARAALGEGGAALPLGDIPDEDLDFVDVVGQMEFSSHTEKAKNHRKQKSSKGNPQGRPQQQQQSQQPQNQQQNRSRPQQQQPQNRQQQGNPQQRQQPQRPPQQKPGQQQPPRNEGRPVQRKPQKPNNNRNNGGQTPPKNDA